MAFTHSRQKTTSSQYHNLPTAESLDDLGPKSPHINSKISDRKKNLWKNYVKKNKITVQDTRVFFPSQIAPPIGSEWIFPSDWDDAVASQKGAATHAHRLGEKVAGGF